MQQQSLFNDLNYDVSVIVILQQASKVLWRCIDSILAQEGVRELLVIDYGLSKSVTRRLNEARIENNKIKIINIDRHKGFAACFNIAVDEARGDYVACVNPYILLPKDSFICLIDELFKYPDAYIASCRLVDPKNVELMESKQHIFDIGNFFSETFYLYWFGVRRLYALKKQDSITNNNKKDDGRSTQAEVISPDIFLIRKEKFYKSGRFDERYYLPDAAMFDFCLHLEETARKAILLNNIKAVKFANRKKSLSQIICYNYNLKLYFKKNFAGAYYPGVLPFVSFILNSKSLLSVISSASGMITKKLQRKKPVALHERYARFLSTYRQFESKDLGINKGSIYDISHHQPILVTGISDQVGLCVIRRLLAAGVKVIVLYSKTIIDFYHPNLIWLPGNLRSSKIDLRGLTPKALIHSADISLLSYHLEDFAKLGIKRIICFNHVSGGAIGNKRNYSAERDIIKTCPVLEIDYTILRAYTIYGCGFEDEITMVFNFIKKFGFFPVYKGAIGIRKPVHADDLAIASILALNIKKTFGKIYDLTGTEALTYRDMIGSIFDVLGKKRRSISTPIFAPAVLDLLSKIFTVPDGNFLRDMNIDIRENSRDAKNDFNYVARKFLNGGLEDFDYRS